MKKTVLILLLALVQASLAYMEIPLRKGPQNLETSPVMNLMSTEEYYASLMTVNEDEEYYYEQILTNYQDFQYFGKLYVGSE